MLYLQSEKDDGFGWSRLITAGLKIALTLLTAPPVPDGIDKSDPGYADSPGSDVPTQAILGTIISAVTGSEDAKEVAKMARQATEVGVLKGTALLSMMLLLGEFSSQAIV